MLATMITITTQKSIFWNTFIFQIIEIIIDK